MSLDKRLILFGWCVAHFVTALARTSTFPRLHRLDFNLVANTGTGYMAAWAKEYCIGRTNYLGRYDGFSGSLKGLGDMVNINS